MDNSNLGEELDRLNATVDAMGATLDAMLDAQGKLRASLAMRQAGIASDSYALSPADPYPVTGEDRADSDPALEHSNPDAPCEPIDTPRLSRYPFGLGRSWPPMRH